MKISGVCLLFLCCYAPNICIGQAGTDSVSAPASKLFKISKGRTFWMGLNYRREWLTPIKVPVVDFSKEKGGLTVVKRGGGKQTRSLRVEDPNKREYNFRSIQKFITSKTLPGDLQSEAAEDIVADGISASYPYAALSMPVFAKAAGVPYLPLGVVYIPDDPRLGEHRRDFSHLLAYLESKLPDSVEKGDDTEDVVKKLWEDNDNKVDQHAMLRARILDMFVMDFDRHEGQWEWGAIEKEKGKLFYPIPKDRDQAFFTNDGLLPHMIQWAWLVPQLEGLKPKSKNIRRFNFAARNLDRFFLNQLVENDWKNAVDSFLPQMTDSVIEKALAQQPPELKNISSPEIIRILKERRKYLAAEVLEYYRFIAEIVDISASNKSEHFDVKRNDDGSILLQVFKINDDGNNDEKLYERLFDPRDTKEIRLYGLGGDDKFLVSGNVDKIKVRMIGGRGSDKFESTASSGGVIVYDSIRENNTLTGRLKNKMSKDSIGNYYHPVYYRYNQVIPFISVGFNLDDGLYLGGWMKIIHHGFRKSPYKNSHTITLNHALRTKAFNFRYNAEFIGTFGRRSDLLFEADFQAPNISNFFGYGPNTVYDKSKPGEFRYYWTRYHLGDFALLLRKNFSSKVVMTIGPVFQYFDLDSTDSRNKDRNIVEDPPAGLNLSTVYGKQTYAGGKFTLIADTRDNKILTTKGIYWHTSVRNLSGLTDASYENITQLNSDLSFYIPLIKNRAVLVDRIGAGHNFGDFEFYQAQYLGNEDNLRGYRKNRFAGRTKIYNNIELRVRVANFKTYLFPGSIGLFGFYDAGTVLADNDESKKWRGGYGIGLWVSPLRRLVFTFTYAASKEDKLPLIGLGWRF